MKLIYISLFAALLAASACHRAVPQYNTQTDTTKKVVPQQVNTSNTGEVFSAYINLKDEFLASDTAGIKDAAKRLENKLGGIQGCTETATLANQIAAGNDIKAQRATFLTLSNDVITLVKGTKFSTKPIYIDFCPMADGGKGGYWLSLNQKISNPYFPEHMKECGSVKQQLN